MTRALATLKAHLPPALRRLIDDRRAVSAVEFAFVAPVLITMYLGCVEVSDVVAVQRKVSLTAYTLANLTGQVTTISSSGMTNILNAATAILTPYNSSNATLTVSCISFDANKTMTVKWTAPSGSASVTPTVDSNLQVANSQLIYAEVTYNYTPIVGYQLTGNITLRDHMFMSPRISAPTWVSAACT